MLLIVSDLEITPVDRRNPPKLDAYMCHALLRPISFSCSGEDS